MICHDADSCLEHRSARARQGRGRVSGICLDCGAFHRRNGSRCERCQGKAERKRNASPQRAGRYGAEHRRLRKQWAPIVATGTVACARCGQIIPARGEWDLDHLDAESRPSHAVCNRRAGGQNNKR